MSRPFTPLSERLWRQIDKRGLDECWPWTSKSLTAGYGVIGRGSRSAGKILAHRAVWEDVHGRIPKRPGLHHGYVIMHTCDNRLCCNPRHLRLGTQAENVRDMDCKGRRKAVVAHGAAHHMTKITIEDVRAIRASRERAGILAKRYNLNRNTITRIRTGATWAYEH